MYAQWDTDGTHIDLASGQTVKHKKGDWKINEEGNLYTEKLGKREIYGKQVVNPTDILTTDGSLFNKFDFFDSDDRQKSIAGTTFKLASQIAPYLIPGFNTYYGGVTAAIGLASVLPTFYKAFEGMLIGDNKTSLTDAATSAESYLAKYNQMSISDESQGSMFNYEQIGQMVTQVFSQIYQQRAAASLSNIFYNPKNAVIDKKIAELTEGVNNEFIKNSFKTAGKLSDESLTSIHANIMEKIPGLKELYEDQSKMAKALNLGYMALVTTNDIYGEALQSGYDRRTAGFAALGAAAGQYGIMMNNRMGDWFLDKTTGYTLESNRAMTKLAVKDYLDPIKEAFSKKSSTETKQALGGIFGKMKESFVDIFTSPTVLGENLFKHSIIEGVEEVTEQAVLDTTKGMIDVMGYLGLTKGKGSFGGFSNVFSQSGLENYISNLVGGMIGGPMFELNTTKLEPFINHRILGKEAVTPEVRKSMYQLIANGQGQDVIDELNKQRKYLGNEFITVPDSNDDTADAETSKSRSQADVITDNAIQMVRNIESILHTENLAYTNEEIIKKAFVDQLLIDSLNKAKGDSKVGIEGLVLSDYTENLDKLMLLQSEIQSLSKDDESAAANKAEITRLKDEAKIYKDKLQNILDGKEAENYFSQAMFYLSKPISEKYLAIDRETYAKTKYNKSYYDLPEDGVGLTKKRLNEEWTKYQENKDIRKDLEVATKVYLETEKLSNPYIAKYIESGYSEERRKTIKNLLNLSGTLSIFDTQGTNKNIAVNNFIAVAKELEQRTGKKIIPWDVVKTQFYDHLLSNGYIIDGSTGKPIEDSYLEQEVDVNGQKISRKDLLGDFINQTLQLLPADNIDINLLSRLVSQRVEEVNKGINTNIEELTKQKEDLLATMTPDNSADLQAEISKIDDKINEAKAKTLDIRVIGSYAETQGQQAKLKIAADDYITKVENEKLEAQKEFSDNLLINGQTYDPTRIRSDIQELIDKKDVGTTGKPKARKDTDKLKDIAEYIRQTPIYNYELLENIIKGAGTAKNKIQQITKLLDESKKDWIKFLSLKNKYEAAKNTILGEKSSVEGTNHLWDAVIQEVKNGNLDGELLDFFKTAYNEGMVELQKNDPNQIFSRDELAEMLTLDKKSQRAFEEFMTMFDQHINPTLLPDGSIDPAYEVTRDEVLKQVQAIGNEILRDKVGDILKNVTDLEVAEKPLMALERAVDKISRFVKANPQLVTQMLKSKELLDDSEKHISNSIYDLLKEFDVYLSDNLKLRQKKLFDILKAEEFSLTKVADITNYLSDGVNVGDLKQAMDTISMIQAAVYAMSTTQVGYEDPHGFIATRQQFAQSNKIASDVLNLKTISSDEATLMLQDLERISNKLGFLRNVLLSNAGQLFTEQENIRTKTNKLFVNAWQDLMNRNITAAGNPIIKDIADAIKNENITDEEKLLAIEKQFYDLNKSLSQEDKKSLLRDLKAAYPSTNEATSIYQSDGSDEITKNITELSNNDFLLYLAANLTVNPKDFSIRMHDILKTPEFDKSPFFTQELGIRIAYASIVNSDLFSVIAETNDPLTIKTQHITYLLGDGGTGKTTVGFKVLTLLLQNNNPNLKIWFAAPHQDQAVKLHDEVLSNVDDSKFNKQVYNKKALFDALGLGEMYEKITNLDNKAIFFDKDQGGRLVVDKEQFKDIPLIENLPDVVFIDEVTHFGAHEVFLLNELVAKAKDAGKTIKILGAGDTSQKGFEIEGISSNVDQVSGIFTPRLSLTVRALNSQKRKNNESIAEITKRTRQVWSSGKDDKKVLDLIGSGLRLAYNHDANTLNGDFLTSDAAIPETIFETLANRIKEDPNTKIAILSTTSELPAAWTADFTKYGITEANYKVYTPNNIQGAEGDYFMFNLSAINENSTIASKLRSLYTYVTRAKYGTVIVNDAPNVLPFSLLREREEYTQWITPLRPEVVMENKAHRVEVLKGLIGDSKIEDDYFKFETPGVVEDPENIIQDNLLTGDAEPEPDIKNAKIITQLENGNKPDNGKFMIHSFYNDLNAQVVKKGNVYDIVKNPGSFYGLEASGLSESERDALIDEHIALKYHILNNKGHLEEFAVNNETVAKNAKGEFVVRKSSFNEDYNQPYLKLYGDTSKTLKNGQVFTNLFYKVKAKSGNDVYVHLATFPTLDTVEKSIVGGKTSKMYKDFQNFTSGTKEEFVIDKNKFQVHTSTRLVPWEKAGAARKQFTLEELSTLPGIRFLDITNGSFSKEPVYHLFPNDATNKEAFKEYYRRTTFGEPITEEDLEKLFDKYKGKVFVALSFMEQGFNKGTNKNSQVQLVALKSGTRTLDEVRQIITGGTKEQPKSIRTMILDKGNIDEKNWAEAKKNSLFNANQVLDMLIELAVKNPELYNSLIVENEKKLNTLSADKTLSSDTQFKEFLQEYDTVVKSAVSKIAGNSIIDRIAYGNEALKSVYRLIGNKVAEAQKTKKPLDKAQLRQALISDIKGNREGK